MRQIKKVRIHMTENTSKLFTQAMLDLYDKYKDTEIFKENNFSDNKDNLETKEA